MEQIGTIHLEFLSSRPDDKGRDRDRESMEIFQI